MDPVKCISPCKEPQTIAEKDWPYDEYYIGERDHISRKNGIGQYCWSGAESLESYTGNFLRDTKHGVGEYRCRHRGEEDGHRSWEGHYYNNFMHGYGVMSYPNGTVFSGLYHIDLRWGPGVETHISLRENVGLWKGNMLVRITWKPPLPGVSPDILSTPTGINIAAKNRSFLIAEAKKIGEVNPALDLLKQYGAPALKASQMWSKLYPSNCTDEKSQFFHTDVFDREFYGNKIHTLEPTNMKPEQMSKKGSQTSDTSSETYYYAWNNNANITHMMRHSYQHDYQLTDKSVDIAKILNGPRTHFKPAAQDEINCRTFLIACYLGHIKNVAQLITEYDVYPNVTDMNGNSGLMYATCGNQPEVIHFLIEAGGRVNDYNDACCTPLGVALINYACTWCEIPPCKIVQAILPPTFIDQVDNMILEWKIERSSTTNSPIDLKTQNKNGNNKPLKPSPVAKMKSVLSTTSKFGKLGNQNLQKDSKSEVGSIHEKQILEPLETFSEDKRLYFSLLNEYAVKLTDLYAPVDPKLVIPYIFEVTDMVTEIDQANLLLEQKAVPDKKDLKLEAKKLSRAVITAASMHDTNKNVASDLDEIKANIMNDKMRTIKQLLSDGADPRLVRCPQPALFMAVVSQSAELVELMIKHGADANEVYSETLNYSPLDIAVSRPLSKENLDVIQKLLEGGAKADHRIPVIANDQNSTSNTQVILGPTLLHAVLAKKVEEGRDTEIRKVLLELLLKYNCNPILQYKSRSAMEIAMVKDTEVFNIFVESPKMDLNAVINESNHTILVKMFYMPYCKTIPIAERIQRLTKLLMYGADPLLKCKSEGNCYDNLFVYVKQEYSEILRPSQGKSVTPTPSKELKKSKPEKKSPDKSADKHSSKGAGLTGDEIADFFQALSLVRDCARILFIRWIQATLMKKLIEIVEKYKHRNWIMILKEYKSGKRCGLWLTPIRCLEIWDILKTTKKKLYNDKTVLKSVLCIVHYHFSKKHKILRGLTSKDKGTIESEVAYFIREHTSTTPATMVAQVSKRPYVKPELTPENEFDKFNICFECAETLHDAKIACSLCKLVEFCSFECMRTNIERINCHPCSDYLKRIYFPISEYSESGSDKYLD